jgi:hypothetical protein
MRFHIAKLSINRYWVICHQVYIFFIYNVHRAPRRFTWHGELNQPSPQFQADRPPSVKVYGRIEGHSNLMLILLNVVVLEVITDIEGLVTI